MTYFGTATRHAQNSRMMFACLRESLTEEAQQKVSLESHKFRIQNELDGLLYFKVIVGIAHLDTRATVTVICTRLSSLDTKILDVQDNIIELNAFVQLQQAGLEARGERTDDLLVNLFKACQDTEFKTWVKRAEDNYNKGTNITPEELMTLADNKYQSLIDSGTWLQQTEDQKRIVAMAAQIQSLEKSKTTTVKKDGKKGANTSKNPKKNKKDKNSKKNAKYAWKYEAPKTGQPNKKEIKGTKWYFCPHHGDHGMWVKHTLQRCEIRKKLEAEGKLKDTKPTKEQSLGEASTMKVAGMIATYPDDDDF
jgi:hypothetical protein